jgi:hypothetical protein
VFTAMFGEASCMEENSHDFVEILERSTRTADGTLYDQGDVQDVASLLHSVLWMRWGRLKQGGCGGGSLAISDCGEGSHRQVLLDRTKALDAMVHQWSVRQWQIGCCSRTACQKLCDRGLQHRMVPRCMYQGSTSTTRDQTRTRW